MQYPTASVLFLLLFNPILIERTLGEVVRRSDVFQRQIQRSAPTSEESDDAMMRRIEEDMQQLRKSGQAVRDKRALGILLQGFLESLGYTVSPIQLASLPNVASAAPAPAAGGQSTSAPQRQRETLRFTGLLNFGNGQNASSLASHLTQYEQLFHGNRSAPSTAAPDIDPRSAPKAPGEPHLVKIPMPSAAPAAMPTKKPPVNGHSGQFSREDSSEESFSAADELSREEDTEEELCENEGADDSSEQPGAQRLRDDEGNDESGQSAEGMRFSLAKHEARAEALAEEQLERELQRQQEQAELADDGREDETLTARLPISCSDDEAPRDPSVLRDSYGQRLPEAGVADYVRLFQGPRSGVLEPLDASNRIPGPPGSRYEEYEIEAPDRQEHRAERPPCKCAEASEQRTSFSAREPLQPGDRGIIQRLTSHDRQPASRWIGAWPAPFDYLYDDSENEDKLNMTFEHRSAESSRSERPSVEPRGFLESSSAKPIPKVDGRAKNKLQQNRPASKYGRADYRATNSKPASRPADITTARPDKRPSTKSPPREGRKIPITNTGEQAPQALSMTKLRQTSVRPTIRVKYTRPLATSRGDVLEETTNYIEKDARLVVPESTPYDFDEGFQGFTNEPASQTNTDRVKIKRYRNLVASVKVSELKHPQPQSSMKIFKYARNL